MTFRRFFCSAVSVRAVGLGLLLLTLPAGVLDIRAGEARFGEKLVADRLEGPVRARVMQVIDGDTLLVRAHIWLGQEVEVRVRILGVDAPEMNGKCESERIRARAAKDFLADRAGDDVVLQAVMHDKYGGRVDARVFTPAGEDIGGALVDAGLARAYDGGKRGAWCG